MVGLLPDDSPRSLAIATGLGAASSSCSYAAVALARSIFRKGGNFTAAMAFEFASTNLVVELGVILAVLMGWQFTLAEFVGGPLMMIFLAVLFRLFLRAELVADARWHADQGALGRMEGHAAMDMSLEGGTVRSRIFSGRGFTAISHFYVMDWASIYTDIILGLLIAGSLAAWVPETFWQRFFLVDHPILSKIWGPIVGPLVAIVSFVCSIGNVPLAAVLRNGGISFGGVISFIFADLIVLPILNIYRKVLRLEDGRVPVRHVLRHHGRRGVRRRDPLRRPRPDPRATQRQGPRSRHHVELHHRPQPHLPDTHRDPRRSLPHHRRTSHAAHDEGAGDGEPR
jgi:uncharacterized membrane protein YraQ (UPF0718 family)